MSTPYFRFKRFIVWHDRCAMKVGTDGTLLGAWVHTASCRNVLDIGAGTGLIALMVAQRNEKALIDGIEIDPDASAQATDNVAASPFAQRIRIFHTSLQDFARTTDQRYDLIVSNPPYFARSLKCPDEKRRLARHSDGLSLSGLIGESASLLTPDGRLALILPYPQQAEPEHWIHTYGLYCIRQTSVCPVAGAAPKRLLVELSRQSHAPVKTGCLILEDDQRRRTAAYEALTRDFYL